MSLQRIYDKETGKTTYSFSKWYNKVFYWIGVITMVYLSIWFIIGLIVGIAENL